MLYVWVVPSRNLFQDPSSLTSRVKVKYDKTKTVYDALEDICRHEHFRLVKHAIMCETPYGAPLEMDKPLSDIQCLHTKGKILYARAFHDTPKDHLKSKFFNINYRKS